MPALGVFFAKTLSVESIRDIQAECPIVDNLGNEEMMFFFLSWEKASIKPFQIEKAGICTSRNCQFRCQSCAECSTEGLGDEIDYKDILELWHIIFY